MRHAFACSASGEPSRSDPDEGPSEVGDTSAYGIIANVVAGGPPRAPETIVPADILFAGSKYLGLGIKA